MQVTLSWNGQAFTAELPISLTLALPALRETAELTVTLPVDLLTPAAAAIVRAGAVLTALTPWGVWRGVIDEPQPNEAGWQITAYHPVRWLDLRPVAPQQELLGLPAGAIARLAVTQAMAGLGATPIRIGPCVEAPPPITSYTFRGQSALQVLTDLMDQTEQEFLVTPDGEFRWVAQGTALWHDRVVVDALGHFGPLPGESLNELAWEVTEVRAGLPWTIRDTRVPATWPRAVVLGTQGG